MQEGIRRTYKLCSRNSRPGILILRIYQNPIPSDQISDSCCSVPTPRIITLLHHIILSYYLLSAAAYHTAAVLHLAPTLVETSSIKYRVHLLLTLSKHQAPSTKHQAPSTKSTKQRRVFEFSNFSRTSDRTQSACDTLPFKSSCYHILSGSRGTVY